MENIEESAMEVAKGIEEVFLDSSRKVKELIDEGKKLIEKGAEKHE